MNERIPENVREQPRDPASPRGGRSLGRSRSSGGRREERKPGSTSRQHSSAPVKVESFPALDVPKTTSHTHTQTHTHKVIVLPIRHFFFFCMPGFFFLLRKTCLSNHGGLFRDDQRKLLEPEATCTEMLAPHLSPRVRILQMRRSAHVKHACVY